MELHIDKESTVNDVQTTFSTFYPFLKLRFIKSGQPENNTTKKLVKIMPELPVKKLEITHYPVNVSVEKNVTVAQLLKNLKEIGLLVQLCRKSGNLWVETSLTYDWTLERQNIEAMLISILHEKPY